jgi:hypothetical protein
MRYPSAEDYMKAVQQPDPFTTDELRRMELVVHPVFQIPSPAAGTSAVVFKALADGEAQALRFFTREDNWSGERYSALHDHFTARGLASLVAMPRWVNDGIRVNDRTWPVVRMQWVDGHTLNKYVEDLVEQRARQALHSLAATWLELVTRLQGAEFAHGDLQHGNVMVDGQGELRLVDFDCAWIGRFAGHTAPSETGHRNYQLEARAWDKWMDTFPGLVIYTSLLALSKNPNPWHALHTGENLLFRHEDFHPPFQTPTWAHLSSIQDEQLDLLAARLKECCAPGWAPSGLEELLGPRQIPWWERTPVPVTASPTPPRLAPPLPAQWPNTRTPPSRPLAEEPTRNWWREPAAQDGRGRPVPVRQRKKPRVGRVVAAALGSGFAAAVLCAAVAEGAGGEGEAGALVGLLVAIIVIIGGIARRFR